MKELHHYLSKNRNVYISLFHIIYGGEKMKNIMRQIIAEYDVNLNETLDLFKSDKDKTYDFIIKYIDLLNKLSEYFYIEIIIKNGIAVTRIRK